MSHPKRAGWSILSKKAQKPLMRTLHELTARQTTTATNLPRHVTIARRSWHQGQVLRRMGSWLLSCSHQASEMLMELIQIVVVIALSVAVSLAAARAILTASLFLM